MSVAIANAVNQYVFRRNFTLRKWEGLAGEGRTCRVQVTKKSSGDYILKIIPEVGEVISMPTNTSRLIACCPF